MLFQNENTMNNLKYSTISPNDDMLHNNNITHYESVGRELAEYVKKSATDLHQCYILELPCGHGRVTRWLKAYADEMHFNLHSYDVLPDAIDFQRKYINPCSYLISPPFTEYNEIKDRMYDIAVMGSLITHLSEADSCKILSEISNKLKHDSKFIITTHGMRSYQKLKLSNIYQTSEEDREVLIKKFESDEFGFVTYKKDHSLEARTTDFIGDSYGISIIPPIWIKRQLDSLGFECVESVEGGWDNHQDVFIFKKL